MTDAADNLTFPRVGEGPIFEGRKIWLPQMAMEAFAAGQSLIEGKTFLDCRIEGPAVLLPISGCEFDACDMGESGGDTRNLLLAPVGPQRVVGAVVFQNCIFRRCTFYAVGFTGSPDFVKQFQSAVQGPRG